MAHRQSKYWVATHNNWTPADLVLLQNILGSKCTYYIIEEEIGQSGTRHLQIYFELPTRQRFAQLTQLFQPIRLHLEARKGSAQQAADYCRKDGIVHESGVLSSPRPGERTDLKALQEVIRSGASWVHIAEEHFGSFLRYEKGIRSYRQLLSAPRSWVTRVIVLWGITGTGKTRRAHTEANDQSKDMYIHGGGHWFDGYEQEELVLFDDFSGSCFPLPYLLKLLDRYPMRVQVKGGFVNWAPKTVYITSNIDPDLWYQGAHEEHRRALRRRFTDVHHYNGDIGIDVLVVE